MRDCKSTDYNLQFNSLGEMMKILNAKDVAELFQANYKTIMELAHTGRLPGAKIGRSWIFIEEDVIDYIRKCANEVKEKQQMKLEALARYKVNAPKTNLPALQNSAKPRRKNNINLWD